MLYSYQALKENKKVNGTIEADDEDSVAQYLKSSGLIIVNIHRGGLNFIPALNTAVNRVAFGDLVDTTRQMSIMLNAGLSIAESLDILKKQTKNEALLKMLTQIDDEVRAGNSFSTSLKKFPNVFNKLYIALVRAGEASGKLDEVMSRLAETLENQRSFQSKTKNALIYPALIVVVMLGVITLMITVVVPQLLSLYKDFNVELPATTKFLISLSNFLRTFGVFLLAGLIAGIVALRKYMKTPVGHRQFDNFILKIPVINKVIKVSALVNSTRILSVLVQAGVPILQALDIIVETTENILYQDAFKSIRSKVEKGSTLGKALESEQIFPPIFVQMTNVGEKTGHLDETLSHVAKYFESEAELAVKAITVMIEPAILIILGFVVGFIIISVITPIFSLTQAF